MSHKKAASLSILVFNVGSSSLTFKLFRDWDVILRGKCHHVGVKSSEASFVE